MLIIVRTSNYGTGDFVVEPHWGVLGRRLFSYWLGSSCRTKLNDIGIEYTYRGFADYQFSKEDNYIEYVLAVEEEDYDLIKLALSRVRMYYSDRDNMTQIVVMQDRQRCGMRLDHCEDWEWYLSNPPKPVVLLAACSLHGSNCNPLSNNSKLRLM